MGCELADVALTRESLDSTGGTPMAVKCGCATKLSRLALSIIATTWFLSCTTMIQPVKCEAGPYRCNAGSRDVKFCENEVVAVQGSDCADMGLAVSKHFCVVTSATCTDTHYEVKGRDCNVLEYRSVREWRECSPGTPTFAP
jgi:hypothetical protein